jgi:hypothetical protein
MYNVGTTEVLQGYYGCTPGGGCGTLVDRRSAKWLWRREIAANRPERRRVPVVGGEYGSDGGPGLRCGDDGAGLFGEVVPAVRGVPTHLTKTRTHECAP